MRPSFLSDPVPSPPSSSPPPPWSARSSAATARLSSSPSPASTPSPPSTPPPSSFALPPPSTTPTPTTTQIQVRLLSMEVTIDAAIVAHPLDPIAAAGPAGPGRGCQIRRTRSRPPDLPDPPDPVAVADLPDLLRRLRLPATTAILSISTSCRSSCLRIIDGLMPTARAWSMSAPLLEPCGDPAPMLMMRRPPDKSSASGDGGWSTTRKPFVIGVSGGTASGKTTVCDMIIQQLHDHRVVLVSQDSFYHGLTEEQSEHVQD